MPVLVIAFVIVFLVMGVLVVKIVRSLGRSKQVVLVARTDAVRAEARAESAERTADRITGIAEQAVNVAGVIQDVDSKMDVLLGMVTGEKPEVSAPGRHVLPGERQAITEGGPLA